MWKTWVSCKGIFSIFNNNVNWPTHQSSKEIEKKRATKAKPWYIPYDRWIIELKCDFFICTKWNICRWVFDADYKSLVVKMNKRTCERHESPVKEYFQFLIITLTDHPTKVRKKLRRKERRKRKRATKA